MPSQFIKSSSRTKADPLYYKRKADQGAAKRDAMFAEVERLESLAGGETAESMAIHRKAIVTPSRPARRKRTRLVGREALRDD